jgi:hypothetical protein
MKGKDDSRDANLGQEVARWHESPFHGDDETLKQRGFDELQLQTWLDDGGSALLQD